MDDIKFDLQGIVEAARETRHSFFDMFEQFMDLKRYSEICTDHLLELDMIDQIEVLKRVIAFAELSKKLCYKYNFFEEGEED